jgi:alpha 1,3-glucosidase
MSQAAIHDVPERRSGIQHRRPVLHRLVWLARQTRHSKRSKRSLHLPRRRPGLLALHIQTHSQLTSPPQVYYDYFTHHAYRGSPKGRFITVPADLHEIPLLVRGGSIVPTRERPRRSSPLMKHDPFTLRVALDTTGSARGELYLDDGETYAHALGDMVWRGLVAETQGKGKGRTVRIASVDLAAGGTGVGVYDPLNEFARSVGEVRVEKVVVVGLGTKPLSVVLENGKELEWEYTPGVGSKKEGQPGVLVVKDPAMGVVEDWAIIVKL